MNPNQQGDLMGATTKDDDTTVTIEANGVRSRSLPVGELKEHAEEIADEIGLRDRIDEARDRLREDPPPSQLSFQLGAGRADKPAFASLKLSGSVRVPRDLLYQEHVTITIADTRGEVLAQSPATVDWPTFKTKDGLTERVHTATVDY